MANIEDSHAMLLRGGFIRQVCWEASQGTTGRKLIILGPFWSIPISTVGSKDSGEA